MKRFKNIPEREMLESLVFVYPTETCYGIGCSVLKPDLVTRIYKIKKRGFNKPVSWLVRDIEMAEEFVVFSHKARMLATRFWPGNITLVLQATGKGGEISGYDSIGVRISSHKVTHRIVETLGSPIVTTSCNISGEQACYSAEEVFRVFSAQQEQPDFIVDGGVLQHNPPSTVIKVQGEHIEILRQGVARI